MQERGGCGGRCQASPPTPSSLGYASNLSEEGVGVNALLSLAF